MGLLDKLKQILSPEEKRQLDTYEDMTDKEKEAVEDMVVHSNKENINNFTEWLKKVHELTSFPIEQQREKFGKYINELSEEIYIQYFPKIIEIIQKNKEKCQQFKNSKEQVDNIISWCPRLKDHEELILLYIQERRKKYKLEV